MQMTHQLSVQIDTAQDQLNKTKMTESPLRNLTIKLLANFVLFAAASRAEQ